MKIWTGVWLGAELLVPGLERVALEIIILPSMALGGAAVLVDLDS